MARPCAYDREELLRCAVLFWRRGFSGTSVDDVVRATGVSRSSLYLAFPDKSALFLAALEHYLERVTRARLERLAQGDDAARAIRKFLLEIAEEPRDGNAPAHGCLLTNTAVELGTGDTRVAETVRKALARLERGLAARLEDARRQGVLSAGADPTQFARLLVALVQGLRVMSRLGTEPRLARGTARARGTGGAPPRRRRRRYPGPVPRAGPDRAPPEAPRRRVRRRLDRGLDQRIDRDLARPSDRSDGRAGLFYLEKYGTRTPSSAMSTQVRTGFAVKR